MWFTVDKDLQRKKHIPIEVYFLCSFFFHPYNCIAKSNFVEFGPNHRVSTEKLIPRVSRIFPTEKHTRKNKYFYETLLEKMLRFAAFFGD